HPDLLSFPTRRSSDLLLLGPETSAYVIAMYSASLFFLNGPFAAMLFYMGESYPAHVRGVGANLAHVMAPAGAILGSGLISVLLGDRKSTRLNSSHVSI